MSALKMQQVQLAHRLLDPGLGPSLAACLRAARVMMNLEAW